MTFEAELDLTTATAPRFRSDAAVAAVTFDAIAEGIAPSPSTCDIGLIRRPNVEARA